jgi:alpha-L-fucosidase 2
MESVSRRGFLKVAGGTTALSVLPAVAGRSAYAAAAPSAGGAAGAITYPERGVVSTTWTTAWDSGFVTGNGNLGAVVYGVPEAPTVLVNQHQLYTSQYPPSQEDKIAQTAQFLPQMRSMIQDQGYSAMLDYSWQELQENGLAPSESIGYHPGCFLNCTLDGADQASGYARSENFATGEVETAWTGTAGSFRTRVFASRADEVVVFWIGGPGNGKLNATLSIPPPGTNRITSAPESGDAWIGFHNLYPPGNGGYDGVVRFTTSGGSAQVSNGAIVISGADEALLLMRIERFRPPQAGGTAALAAAVATLPPDYSALLHRHVQIHGAIFNRTRLDLGAGADRTLTTDALIAQAIRDRTMPPALMEKVYDACRYVILSSSGDLPPNLQGIWNGSWNPPFNDDYSTDTNLELAIDSTCSANMPELLNGFFSLIEMGVPSWQEGAQKLARCHGILYPARMQDQGTYFQQTHDWQWFNQLAITGWFGHYFYDYYRYTGDRGFLENRAIPYLKQCALFYEDWFISDPDGTLRSTPDFSYESASSDNATINIAAAREVLSNLIEGCDLLGIEQDNVGRWQALLAKLPQYMINTPETTGGTAPPYWLMTPGEPATPDGTLKEFIEPNMLEFPNHRHMSHLYPLFVSNEFSPQGTPDLFTAAAKAWEKKVQTYKGTESHYRMQASLCAGRLGRGNDIWSFLALMAANDVFHTSLVPSHYDNLNVFNVDASGGIPSVINNSLVFSGPGQLDLLPALPGAFAKGSISGILARGQITVDELAWDMPGGDVAAKLTSAISQKVTIGLPPGISNAKAVINGRPQQIADLGAGKQGCQVTVHPGENTVAVTFTGFVPVRLLSQGCAVTASSTRTQDGNVVPANVADGDLTTRWTSDYADNQWIMIDLGGSHQITDVKLYWEAAAGKDYDIAVSADGQNWTTVAAVTGNTQAGWFDYPGLTAQGRYVRLDCLTRLTSNGFSLWEFQVFGQ